MEHALAALNFDLITIRSNSQHRLGRILAEKGSSPDIAAQHRARGVAGLVLDDVFRHAGFG